MLLDVLEVCGFHFVHPFTRNFHRQIQTRQSGAFTRYCFSLRVLEFNNIASGLDEPLREAMLFGAVRNFGPCCLRSHQKITLKYSSTAPIKAAIVKLISTC